MPKESQQTNSAEQGRLHIQAAQIPVSEERQVVSFGTQELRLNAERDALLYVPSSIQPDRPAPLAVMLHGAGGNAQDGLALLRDYAEGAAMLLLAPASYYETWDRLVATYGSDVAVIEEALEQTMRFYAIDPAHLAIGGFSDGASYALSLGLTNGDLFSHIIAFSPGFMAPASVHGRPQIFITHGVHDTVLPIERCSRRIVPQLERAGYPVHYHEFDGSHTIPAKLAREAVTWLCGPSAY